MEILEKVKQRELVNTECLIIKMSFKFLFNTVGVCDHSKFTWEKVPLCWTAETFYTATTVLLHWGCCYILFAYLFIIKWYKNIMQISTTN